METSSPLTLQVSKELPYTMIRYDFSHKAQKSPSFHLQLQIWLYSTNLSHSSLRTDEIKIDLFYSVFLDFLYGVDDSLILIVHEIINNLL